ncbi:hypothetical protein B0T20DRAFT_348538, partial [Sordaria brevicollis]
ENADKLNFYRPNVNYKIIIKKDKNGKEFLILFGLFYNIIKEEFLIFKKTLKDLLNKGFIRINNLKIGALILFIRKSGGKFRFYNNYYIFNAITKVDRYLLPLIKNIFRILKGIK